MEIRNADPDLLTVGWVQSPLIPGEISTTFVVKATLRLVPGGVAERREDPPETLSGDRREDDDPALPLVYPSDFAPFKPKGDVLVVGTVYAPAGGANLAQATIQVGTLLKTLIVFGDREWQGGGLLRGKTPSDARGFESIPLSYRFAHGGPEFAPNPAGRGYKTDALPNFELPGHLLTGPKTKTPPAGFGPIAPEWESRSNLVGTYHDKWAAERWPCPPRDFDYTHFCAAPADQQVAGFLRGDEDLRFQHLHAEHEDYGCRLPGLRARCFLNRATEAGETFAEVDLELDTLWADLDSETLVLVWRGRAPVRTTQMTDVLDVFVFAESLDAPKGTPDAHRARMVALDAEEAEFDEDDTADLTAEFEGFEAGVDAQFVEFEQGQAEALAAADRAFAEAGGAPVAGPQNIGEIVAALEQSVQSGAVPADELDLVSKQIVDLKDAAAATEQAEAEATAFAAEFDAADEAAWTREVVIQRLADKQPLTGLELGELDLSELDFTGVDLSESDLRETDLHGSTFRDARLAGVAFVGANLVGCDFSGACLDHADLTQSIVTDTKFEGATLNSADFAGLDLAGVSFAKTTGEFADLSGANLAGASFSGAQLSRVDWVASDLSSADCTGAKLIHAEMHAAKATGVDFTGTDLSGARATKGADFTDANFTGVTAEDSVWEQAVLDQAMLSGANFARAQFAGASLRLARCDRTDLRAAVFDDANLTGASMIYANLLRASFANATLAQVNLGGANLFEAGFVDAKLDGATIDGANIDRTLLAKKR